ncbi:hypothetical protein WIT60_05085 [Aquabacterium sp. G14]|uniref:hypothetical protein n=1 Tax=Aquabacterium sp. G14 TaxID=3130164 RepID=UPI00309F2874
MISERAKASLDSMVMQGIRSALVSPADAIVSLETVETLEPITEQEVVMLSVVSYHFRVVMMVYFTRDERTRLHFSRLTKNDGSPLDDQGIYDALYESANMCCGTFNRELGRVFEHVGMSTPNMIDSRCAEHLAILDYGYLKHYALVLDSGISFRLSLCVTEYHDLDFELESTAQAESTGELEFF